MIDLGCHNSLLYNYGLLIKSYKYLLDIKMNRI
jgi:hypothetical protein